MFRDVFYYNLLPELKARGKTVIVISHDDRYYHLGDRLIRLEDGQLEYDQPSGQTDPTLGGIVLPAAEVVASSGR
jgi:putative ATP-binding cassette transporter